MKPTALVVMFLLLSLSGPIGALADVPQNPGGVTLSSSSNAVTVTWSANTDGITDGYYVYHWVTTDSSQPTRKTILHVDGTVNYTHVITGLIDNTDYTIKVTAYDGDDESNSSNRTVTTSAIDLTVTLTAAGTIDIRLGEGYDSVESYDLYVGTSHVVPDPVTHIPDVTQYDVLSVTGLAGDTVYTLTGLNRQTYYIFAQVNYGSGSSSLIDEIAFDVDDFGTFFSNAGDIDNGCFIGNTAPAAWSGCASATALAVLAVTALLFAGRIRIPLLALLMMVLYGSQGYARDESPDTYKNLVGVKVGWFVPSEDLQKDVYDTIVPTCLFYERMLTRFFSADASAGYTRAKGYAVTTSSAETGVRTDLDIVPFSMSLNVNLPVHELISLYMGAGGDYWGFRESSPNGDFDNEIGGWHGKAGIKLFTGDSEYYRRGGVLIEACYTALDRFGDNDADLGGWTYSLGVMYCF
ncbi:hypothetical protein JCM14469_30180 [Desulfatiferula olefinivorans]